LLDLLFGTWFMPPSGARRYGIDGAMPDGWFAQLAHPLPAILAIRRRPGRG
jgi:hypothetical protein